MRGHRQVIAARREGLRPAAVFINLVDRHEPVTNKYDDPENGLRFGFYPNIEIERDDLRKAIDLRFVVGLAVHVYTDADDEDTGRLLDMLEAQNPDRIAACMGPVMMFFAYGKWEAWAQ